MKTRSMLIGVAMAAALNCAAVNAQVLGGVGGGLGGTLSGGLRDMGVTTQGTLNGSLGADLDTSTLRRTTSDTAERATNRARNTTSAVRDSAAAKLDQAQKDVGEKRQMATAAAAASVVGAIDTVQIEGAADVAGSATSNLSRDGVNLAGAPQGAGSAAVSGVGVPQSDLTNAAPGKLAGGEAANVSSVTRQVSEPAQSAGPSEAGPATGVLNASGAGSASSGSELIGTTTANDATQSSTAGAGLLDASAKRPVEPSQTESAAKPASALSASGGANGSASASRSGVSANGSGSVSASHK